MRTNIQLQVAPREAGATPASPSRPCRVGAVAATALLAFLLAACRPGSSEATGPQLPPQDLARLDPRLAPFLAAKEQQARVLAEKLGVKVSPDVWRWFQTAARGDWGTASNLFASLQRRNSQYAGAQDDPTVGTVVWQPLMEAFMALQQFVVGDPGSAAAFGDGIIASIPPGGIYFGGTDPGRGLVTALCKSQINGDPFFTLTQNALVDARYLSYVRQMYGDKIRLPTDEEAQRCVQEYRDDAQRRLEGGQLKPGEEVRMADGKVQISGQVAVMQVNGLLARAIFDQNPDREFYVEESFPLDWMYPHLSPQGLILKINREPVPEISEAMVAQNHEVWNRHTGQFLGGWLTEGTPLQRVCEFAERVHLRKDLGGFKGDLKFIRNHYACVNWSKLRSSLGGLYAWRAQNAKTAAERERMVRAADWAYRQALALCPYSPEAVFRYASLLAEQKRVADAQLVVRVATAFNPDDPSLRALREQLAKSQ